MKILSIDVGYGDVKCIYGDSSGNITKKFKVPSVVGLVGHNDIVTDNRQYLYKDKYYYVGEDALALESNRIIDVLDYNNLEYFAPLFLIHIISIVNEMPDKIVTGLSKAQIGNSGHFKKAISDFVVNGYNYKFTDVNVLPQGVPSKLTIEKYGCDYPKLNTEFLDKTSYICVDIGFNTLDTFQAINGVTSANLAEGIEGLGVMTLADEVKKIIANDNRFNRTITLKEAKDVLDTKTYTLRGKHYDLSNEILQLKKQYLKRINEVIESRYGTIIDKMYAIYLIGGGSYLFKELDDGFYRVPKAENEFYNAIGFYLRYCKGE